MLRVPGFISDVMDLTLSTAPYPNTGLAFCGAMALQSFLCARKVRDYMDNRSNIHLLALASSSSGKDHPRKVNVKILSKVGLGMCIGNKFASGEGLQDALQQHRAMLFQNDEIDDMLLSISRSRDARFESVMSSLLMFYSHSNQPFHVRKKAGRAEQSEIDQPSLTLFGTACPGHYYSALSERMLTNGFFARMIVVDVGKRGEGQDAGLIEVPENILEIARYWRDLPCRPGCGNLSDEHPEGKVLIMRGGRSDQKTTLSKSNLYQEVGFGKHTARLLNPFFNTSAEDYDAQLEKLRPQLWKGYEKGFVRTACWACPFQRKVQWDALKKHYPLLADEMARFARRLNWKQYKGDKTFQRLRKYWLGAEARTTPASPEDSKRPAVEKGDSGQ